eukprot:784198_1
MKFANLVPTRTLQTEQHYVTEEMHHVGDRSLIGRQSSHWVRSKESAVWHDQIRTSEKFHLYRHQLELPFPLHRGKTAAFVFNAIKLFAKFERQRTLQRSIILVG